MIKLNSAYFDDRKYANKYSIVEKAEEYGDSYVEIANFVIEESLMFPEQYMGLLVQYTSRICEDGKAEYFKSLPREYKIVFL